MPLRTKRRRTRRRRTKRRRTKRRRTKRRKLTRKKIGNGAAISTLKRGYGSYANWEKHTPEDWERSPKQPFEQYFSPFEEKVPEEIKNTSTNKKPIKKLSNRKKARRKRRDLSRASKTPES